MYETFYSSDSSTAPSADSPYPANIGHLVSSDTSLRSSLAEAHAGLGTQLEDSGLVDLAMRHFQRSYEIGGGDDVKVKRALQVPVLYDSVEHVEKSRRDLLDGLKELEVRSGEERTAPLRKKYCSVRRSPALLTHRSFLAPHFAHRCRYRFLVAG